MFIIFKMSSNILFCLIRCKNSQFTTKNRKEVNFSYLRTQYQ